MDALEERLHELAMELGRYPSESRDQLDARARRVRTQRRVLRASTAALTLVVGIAVLLLVAGGSPASRVETPGAPSSDPSALRPVLGSCTPTSAREFHVVGLPLRIPPFSPP